MNIDVRTTRHPAAAVSVLLSAVLFLAAGVARGQDTTPPADPQQDPPATTTITTVTATPMFDDSIDAVEAETPPARRKLVKWNEYAGPYATFKFGSSAMYDVATYSQDEGSQEQFDLEPAGKWRDFRFVFSGTFPKFKPVTWKAGVMWDGATQQWLVRESGLIIAVPKLWGHLFVGRTKEGFSMVKHMVGTSIWGLERSPMLDGAIPIMADGVRWMGYREKRHIVWNLGFYNEKYSQSRHAPYYDRQAVARIAWLPLAVQDTGTLLHIGLNLRYADPQDGKLQFRARPEAITAPYFIDTGTFPAKHTTMVGPEVYYRQGSLIVGSEYYFEKVDSKETGDPTFHGGDVTAIWAITGETRSYSTRGGLFGFLTPSTSVFEGGPGAWEATLRLSYTDATSGTLEGGRLWRISPLLAWYLNDNVRWTVGYGYGILDRFDQDGATHFFQSRIHMQF